MSKVSKVFIIVIVLMLALIPLSAVFADSFWVVNSFQYVSYGHNNGGMFTSYSCRGHRAHAGLYAEGHGSVDRFNSEVGAIANVRLENAPEYLYHRHTFGEW